MILHDFANLPDIPAIATLKSKRQWVSWRYLERTKLDGSKYMTKVPVCPNGNYNASTSDPATWGSYDEAVANALKHKLAGVGYVLTNGDNIYGNDLDGVRDPATGTLQDFAQEIVNLGETYTEVSPSGRGVRQFCIGKLGAALKHVDAQVESYESGRYLTVTGDWISGTADEIREAPQTLALLKARVDKFKAADAKKKPPKKKKQKADPKEGINFFRAVNDAALAALELWVPILFPGAKFQPGTGAWRVTSQELGRNLEEDLSLHPSGITDWGIDDQGAAPQGGGRYTAIDVLIEHGGAPDAKAAALWLCEKCGIDPASLGWSNLPVIKYGPLSVMADVAAKVLIDAKVPFYQRGNKLVRPVVVAAQTFRGKATSVAQLVEVELPYLRDTLCRKSQWIKFDKRANKWLPAHPSPDAALVLLKKFGDWEFPVIAGIITTPTLRPDGTILSQAGYDPATQLLLIDPPAMPEIPEHPTKADALASLELLSDLLVEFRFDDDGRVSRAVALSAMLSTVCRGAYPVLPMHVIDAPAAGSGKSYLLSLVSLIATGQEMPVLGTGKSEEEMEKRIGAELIHGQTLICIDNVVGELGGDALCRLIEQPRPSVRILGKSENVEARGTTFFANGNNIIIVGDLYRRVIRCRLDAKMERPELRNYQSNPKEMILADRGKYIAACLTIARAYIAAGRPDKCPQLGSFGDWSDTVRSALVWLGEADPVGSMDAAKAADPETGALLTMLNEWTSQFGTGKENAVSARMVIERCEENTSTGLLGISGKDYTHAALRSAVLAVMPIQHNLKPDARCLGMWLSSKTERRVGNLRFASRPATGHSPTQWWVEEEKTA